MSESRVATFVTIYQQLNKHTLHLLADIYHQDIVFSDPLHKVSGLAQLHEYFADLYSNVSECKFAINATYCSDDDAFIYWVMTYRHPKLAGNKQIDVSGHSHLVFQQDKIIQHQDFFDVGALLYRHIPIVGSVIKLIDKRATGV